MNIGMQTIVEQFRIENEIHRSKNQQDWQMTLSLYDQLIMLKNTQPIPNKLGLAKVVAEKALIYEQMGMNAEALRQYETARQIALGTPNHAFIEILMGRMAALQRVL
jgi:hypothetical protein